MKTTAPKQYASKDLKVMELGLTRIGTVYDQIVGLSDLATMSKCKVSQLPSLLATVTDTS